MKKVISIFKGAAVVHDADMEKKGVYVSTNTGEKVDEVPATGSNIKKYIKDKKVPALDKE